MPGLEGASLMVLSQLVHLATLLDKVGLHTVLCALVGRGQVLQPSGYVGQIAATQLQQLFEGIFGVHGLCGRTSSLS